MEMELWDVKDEMVFVIWMKKEMREKKNVEN